MRYRALLLLLMLAASCNQVPKSYDDCILNYVKEGMDKSAVAAVRASCRSKFPSPSSASMERSLTADELAQLTGRGGLEVGNLYEADIYNGTDRLMVRHIGLLISTTTNGQKVQRDRKSVV